MLAEDGDAPIALVDRPAVDVHLEIFWQAFCELSTDRRNDGMSGPGPLPFSAIDRYADRYGFEGDEFERFRSHMRAMDDVFLKVESERRKKATKPKGT